MIASYFYRASKISLQLITEDMRDRIAHMQENPRFISRGGAFDIDTLKTVVEAEVTVSETECTAGIREIPFLLRKGSDFCTIEIPRKYNNDEPLYKGACCTNRDFVIAWAMAYFVLGFLESPSFKKECDELLFERDCSLIFACLYFGIEVVKIAA